MKSKDCGFIGAGDCGSDLGKFSASLLLCAEIITEGDFIMWPGLLIFVDSPDISSAIRDATLLFNGKVSVFSFKSSFSSYIN